MQSGHAISQKGMSDVQNEPKHQREMMQICTIDSLKSHQRCKHTSNAISSQRDAIAESPKFKNAKA
jgi:hypothetical protein